MRRRFGIAVGATIGMTVACLSGVAPAQAADDPVLDALANVTAQPGPEATNVLDGVAQVPTDGSGPTAVDADVSGGSVSIPTDPSEPLSLAIPNTDLGMTVQLPFGSSALNAAPLAPGVVAYDNGNDSTTAPVVKSDGSVQITTVIASADAPSRYDYRVGGADGSSLQLLANGAVTLTRGDELLGGFTPAWARDAAGRSVPTHYEVSGEVLTQVVDLSDPAIAYPVVADPSASYVLLAGEWKNRPGGYKYKNGDQWSTHLSGWGAFVWTQGILGNAAIRVQAWKEWVNGPAPTTTTIHQQFDCHVTFGYAVWKAGLWWDFETARPSHPNWLFDPDDCNWTS